MHADEKRRVAYHESAHALVAASLPNTDPVHKVSIIPRGLAALGYTMQRPEGDRYLVTQSELESRIQVPVGRHGGRGNDLRRRLHRRPERPGAGHRDRPQHGHGLRHEPAGPGDVSGEPPARMFLDGQEELPATAPTASRPPAKSTKRSAASSPQALERVRHVLETRRQALAAIADCLIEQETIDNADLKRIIEANSPSPMIVPGTEEAVPRRRPKMPPPARPARRGRMRAGGKGRRSGTPRLSTSCPRAVGTECLTYLTPRARRRPAPRPGGPPR